MPPAELISPKLVNNGATASEVWDVERSRTGAVAMTVATLTDTAQVIVAVASLCTSAALALVAYLVTKRFAGVEADRSVRAMWGEFNALALSNDDCLRAADAIMSHESRSDEDIEAVRRRWLSYVLINALATGYRHGVTKSSSNPLYLINTTEHHLRHLVRDDLLYALTQSGYERDFTALCRKLREEYEAELSGAPHGIDGDPTEQSPPTP